MLYVCVIVMLRNAFVFYQVMVWTYCIEQFINIEKFEKWHPSKHFLFSKTSSRRLQYVFIKTNVCWDSFSRCQVLEQKHWELSLEIKGNKCNSVFHTAVKALIKLAIAAIKEVISTTIFFLSISSNCKI